MVTQSSTAWEMKARKMRVKLRMFCFKPLADLRRLACLARLPDEAVRLTFVVGFPEAVSSRFRAAKETIDVMLPKLMAALNRKSANESNITATTTHRNVVRTKSPESIVCYNCRGLNHIAKNCAAPKRNVWCYNCKEMRHVVARCTKQHENEEESDRCTLSRT